MIRHLAVCGLGKLGSPIAASFARTGLFVVGYDLDAAKVHAINHGLPPVQEPGLAEAVRDAGLLLRATTDPDEAACSTDACIFVAPTPSLPDGSFDNQYLLDGIDKIAAAVVKVNHRQGTTNAYTFIIASTVTPGSCENVLLPAIRIHSSRIRLAYKPELIALGTVMHDLANPDVGLIGANNYQASQAVVDLYGRLQRHLEFKTMSLVEAELAKISLNCAVTMKISFANQISMVAQQMGADPNVVLDFVGKDSRIGSKALKPGMPFGGPCFPRDNRMFQHIAKKVSITPHLAIATDRINADGLRYILDSIPVDGAVGILGLSYKTGTAITDESPGLAIQAALLREGRTVKVHDPLISPQGLLDALTCRTVIVTLDYAEYRGLRLPPDQFVIDPMGVMTKTQELSVV